MAHSVANLKESISGMLTGTNLDNVTSLDGAIERGARQLLQKVDLPEATGRQQLTLYDGVFNYPVDDGIFGSTIIDLRPQGDTRNTWDFVEKKPISDFDRTKDFQVAGYKVAFEYINGIPMIRVSSNRTLPRSYLDPMSDTTGWTLAGSGSSLTQDTIVYYNAPASLRFTATGASTATLTKDISSQDLTSYQSVGVIFVPVFIPASSASSLTSVTVRLGSSSTAYYESTVTTGFIQSFQSNQWNLLAFDLATATTTGSPTITAMDYLQVRFTTSATITNLRAGGVWISYPSMHELIYATSAIFQASGANPSMTITDDNDTVLLTEPAYTLLEHECALEIALQMGGTEASGLVQMLKNKMFDKENGLYVLYRADNPSQELRMIGNYYDD